jgi:hypothetical protein
MSQSFDFEPSSPDLRRRELAVILATGLLRTVSAPEYVTDLAPCPTPKNLSDSLPNSLELPGNSRLTVQSG